MKIEDDDSAVPNHDTSGSPADQTTVRVVGVVTSGEVSPPDGDVPSCREVEVETSASVLDLIQPPAPSVRFSQGWDPERRRLSIGCGDGARGVVVRSDGTNEVARAGVQSTRFPKEVAKSFLAGQLSGPRGDALSQQLEHFLRDHVHFDDPRHYTLVALWIIGTYLYSIFGHYGYLYLHSTRKRSGKTRLLELLFHVCFQASGPLNAPTPAALREMACEGGTLLLDTLERWREKNSESFSAAMDLLDAGFRSGGKVVKMVPTGQGQWCKEEFPVYAPYAMAAISKDSLSDTALDRSFVVEMHRKPTKVKTSHYNFHQCEKRCAPIRSVLYAWALSNAKAVSAEYESAELGTEIALLGLNDRAADIWQPLFAIGRVLDIDPEDFEQLKAVAREMNVDDEVAEEEHKLDVLRGLARIANEGKVVGTTTELQRQLRNEGVDSPDLHALLTGCGFEQRSIRVSGGPRRAWELTDTQLAEAVAELLGPEIMPTASETHAQEGVSPAKGDYSDYGVHAGGPER